MAMRKTYFAFHYERDIWRANQVRKSGLLFGAKSVGFVDRSLWEKAKTRGTTALENLILDGLNDTSVTVVLLGSETATRRWVQFEVEQSVLRKNAIVGVRIHHLLNQHGQGGRLGAVPKLMREIEAPVHRWDGNAHDLGEWVQEAFANQEYELTWEPENGRRRVIKREVSWW
jgi:hypothetical protein